MLVKQFDNSQLVKFPKLETETINGKRHYVVTGAEKFPSVTTVLDKTADKTYLDEWRKNVGEKQANKISEQAKNRGTALHFMCERYVTNVPFNIKDEAPSNAACFIQIKKALDKWAGPIHAVEATLYSRRLKVAGSTDLVAIWDGELAIVDYKTSTKIKKEEWILDYILQSSMYAYMYWEMTGIMIKKIVVVICVEDLSEPQVFVKNPGDYTKQIASRIKQYYSMN
jgi:genome maintenance exonuclease 1